MGKFRIENYNFCKEKTLDDPNNRFKKIDIKKVLNFQIDKNSQSKEHRGEITKTN